MGASEFFTYGHGRTVQEAFDAACSEARYISGHGGYTGTIAEKHEFTLVTKDVMEQNAAETLAENLLFETNDPRVSDKWGPAGAIEVQPNQRTPQGQREFLFFGYASS